MESVCHMFLILEMADLSTFFKMTVIFLCILGGGGRGWIEIEVLG